MNLNTKGNTEVGRFDWSMLIIISLASIVMGIYRDGIAVLFPFLQRDFDLSRGELSLYISFLYITSSFVSIYTGRLVDLKGSKWGMIFGVSFVGVFLILHAVAPNFFILLVLAAILGIGLSINTPAANKGIMEIFPAKWRSTATGIWSTAFPIGGLLAAAFLPVIGMLIGWRKTIALPGILALICALLILMFYQEKKREKNHFDKNDTKDISFWKTIKQLLNNIDIIILCIYAFFLGAATGTIATHFTLFLYLDYGFTESIAGIGFAVTQLGSIIGKPVWGLICDKLLKANKRKTFLLIGITFFLITLIIGLFLKDLNPSFTIILVLAFLMGGSGRGWQGLFLSSIHEIVKEKQVGTAIGSVLIFLRLGILFVPPVLGYIADFRNSYDLSWLLLGSSFFLASIFQYLFYIKMHNSKKYLTINE